MKFHVAILCVCLVQICPASENVTDNSLETELEQRVRDEVYGASEQFIDDLVFISKKLQNLTTHRESLGDHIITALSKDILNGTNAKIGVDAVKDFTSRSNKGMTRAGEIAELIDMVKLEHSIISKYVAPERLNGVFNLFFALAYTNSTSAEIESALGYLYGTETTETPKLTILDVPNPTPTDCPDLHDSYSKAIDELKSVATIKPKVIKDVIAIRDKFPCIHIVRDFVKRFVDMAAAFPKHPWTEEQGKNITNPDIKFEGLELSLPLRLPDEAFRGLMNFMKGIETGTPAKPGKTLVFLSLTLSHYGTLSVNGGTIRRTMGRKPSAQPAAAAALGKSPPRPSPASVAYHSDEESLKCYDENPDDSSVTEKPSEVSSSESQNSESENESVRSDPHSFVNHYANVNDTLRQSWKRQKPVRNYSSYTDSEPEGSGVMSLNGGQIIVNNMARSRAPLPGFSSFV